MQVTPSGAPLGAEVTGIDLSQPVGAAAFRLIEDTFHDRGVLVFRDQHLTPQQQIDFSRRFGPLDEQPSQGGAHLAGYPDILVISTKKENGRDVGIRDAGPMWHSDLAYRERPSLGSMLYALELPDSGGDTGFANMVSAYERLPARLREAVGNRRGAVRLDAQAVPAFASSR